VVLVRIIVKVWTLKTIGVEPKQILTSIKAHIPKAMVIKVICSGNIKIILPNQYAKGQAIT